MALDKVGIYNDALILLGERRLSSISEAREPRYNLDAIWDIGAVDYFPTGGGVPPGVDVVPPSPP